MGASSYPPLLSNIDSRLYEGASGESGTAGTVPNGGTAGYFGCKNDDIDYRQSEQQHREAPPPPLPSAGDSTYREQLGQQEQYQQHHHHTPRGLADVEDGRRPPMSLALNVSPPLRGGRVRTPALPHGDMQRQEDPLHFQHQHRPDSRSQASLAAPSPMGGDDGPCLSSGVAAAHRVVHEQQLQQQQQSAVGAIIAEVAARRSLRSSSRQQGQKTDTDMEFACRGTPSDDRRAITQPRLLLSELDADGPGTGSPEVDHQPLPQGRAEGAHRTRRFL